MECLKQQENNIGIERRTFNAEYRASTDGVKKIGGMAASYNQYTNMGWFVEVILPGFFDGADTTETACLKNHDPNLILGRTANNTLTLSLLPSGLDYEATPPDTICGNDTYTEVKGGYIYKSSFAFTAKETNWKTVPAETFKGVFPDDVISKLTYGGEIEVRELVKCGTLYDTSPVTYPAYQSTSSEGRNDSSLKEERSRFLGNDRIIEERAKVKVELEIEVDTDGESDAMEMPETPIGQVLPSDEEMVIPTIVQEPTAQIRNNQNRLRVAQARRMQFTITNK